MLTGRQAVLCGCPLRPRCGRCPVLHRRRTMQISCQAHRPKAMDRWLRPVMVGGTALLAACLTQAQQPAWAELETVAPATVSSLARALPKQQVDKGKVWLVVVAGAASLFGAAVLLENNETLFPAIAKANKAMAEARKAQQAKAKIVEAMDAGEDADERLHSAVAAGLNEARQRALQAPASTAEGRSEEQGSTLASSSEEQPHQEQSIARSDAGEVGEQSEPAGSEQQDPPVQRSTEQQADLVQSGSRDR